MNDKVTIEGLKALLNQRKPVPFGPMNASGTLGDMWKVLDELLTLVDDQDKRIKQLEDVLRGDGK